MFKKRQPKAEKSTGDFSGLGENGWSEKCGIPKLEDQETPQWDAVLHRIDHAYVLEYAIADTHGCVSKVLREWEL
jgi:hypothetical protein